MSTENIDRPSRDKTEPAVGKGRTVMILMIVAALGLVIFFNYLMKLREDARNARPGTVGRIEKSITVTERSGAEVRISDLQNKVIVAGLLSTEDPKSISFLKTVQEQFGKTGRLHLLSIAMDPEKEAAESLDAFAKEEGISGENWWLVTGEKKVISGFVTSQLRLGPDDRQLVVADEKGQIIGHYDVSNPDPDLSDAARVRFQKDLSYVMNQLIPIYKSLDKDVTLTDSSGKEVNTRDLDGKIRIVAYVYTRCPNGCAGIADFMGNLNEEFGKDPRLHLLSLSMDPEYDTPEIMSTWAKNNGVGGENWWFLTGDDAKIREFMTGGVGFIETEVKPEEKRNSEIDIYDHDMRIALIDSENRVRTFYAVMSSDIPTMELARDRIRLDLRTLLNGEEPKS